MLAHRHSQRLTAACQRTRKKVVKSRLIPVFTPTPTRELTAVDTLWYAPASPLAVLDCWRIRPFCDESITGHSGGTAQLVQDATVKMKVGVWCVCDYGQGEFFHHGGITGRQSATRARRTLPAISRSHACGNRVSNSCSSSESVASLTQ